MFELIALASLLLFDLFILNLLYTSVAILAQAPEFLLDGSNNGGFAPFFFGKLLTPEPRVCFL